MDNYQSTLKGPLHVANYTCIMIFLTTPTFNQNTRMASLALHVSLITLSNPRTEPMHLCIVVL